MDAFKLTLPRNPATARKPIVVLLGWYGCQDKHLAKYSSLLSSGSSSQAYTTVRGVLPGAAVFSPLALPRRLYARRLLDYLGAVDPEGQRPLVFYVFSNGGCFALEQVDQLVRHDKQYKQYRDRIKGVVYDSAPCYMHMTSGATAIGHGHSLPMRLLAAALFLLSVLLSTVLAPRWRHRYWQRMRDLQLGSKSLYLYSQDDPLCCAAELDQLIQERRQLGADVAALRWQVSQHVGHFIRHTGQYTAALFGFLDQLEG